MTLYFLSVFVHFVLAIYEVLFPSGFKSNDLLPCSYITPKNDLTCQCLISFISIAEKEDRCGHKTLSIITGYMQTRKTRKTLTLFYVD